MNMLICYIVEPDFPIPGYYWVDHGFYINKVYYFYKMSHQSNIDIDIDTNLVIHRFI